MLFKVSSLNLAWFTRFLHGALTLMLSQAIAQIMYRMRSIAPNTVRDALLGSGLFGEFFLKTQVSGSPRSQTGDA